MHLKVLKLHPKYAFQQNNAILSLKIALYAVWVCADAHAPQRTAAAVETRPFYTTFFWFLTFLGAVYALWGTLLRLFLSFLAPF